MMLSLAESIQVITCEEPSTGALGSCKIKNVFSSQKFI